MSRLSKYASKEAGQTAEFYGAAVQNFMGGTSFEVSPLQTLRIVAASSIFGEPQYYRDGLDSKKTISRGMSHREFEIFNWRGWSRFTSRNRKNFWFSKIG